MKQNARFLNFIDERVEKSKDEMKTAIIVTVLCVAITVTIFSIFYSNFTSQNGNIDTVVASALFGGILLFAVGWNLLIKLLNFLNRKRCQKLWKLFLSNFSFGKKYKITNQKMRNVIKNDIKFKKLYDDLSANDKEISFEIYESSTYIILLWNDNIKQEFNYFDYKVLKPLINMI